MLKGKVILVDLDGVLCKGECWEPEQCLEADPIQDNIHKVNRLSQGNFICIWTARCDNLMTATFKWLKENGVMFDSISNKKPGGSFYIDDKSTDFERLIQCLECKKQDLCKANNNPPADCQFFERGEVS